jgi:hypothetical protein
MNYSKNKFDSIIIEIIVEVIISGGINSPELILSLEIILKYKR